MKIDFQELSNIRANILNWYPFEKQSEILEIGTVYEEVTKLLCSKCKEVVSIKNIKEKNVEKQFDYVLLNSVEEQTESLKELLKYANEKVKENGTILLIANNKLGLQTCNYNKEMVTKNYVTKGEIEKSIKQTKFENIKFYYPLPNYKMPNVIFTDVHLPSGESILRDLTIYDEDEILVFDERKKYVEILKENEKLFSFFANSYLVEISNKPDNEIELISFGNSRKEKYRMKTIMKKEVVEKYPIDEKDLEHLEQIKANIQILKSADINILDEAEEKFIKSKVVREVKTFDKILIRLARENRYEELVQKIKKFSEGLKSKLEKSETNENTVFEKYNIQVPKEQKEKLYFIKNCIYDLIFQNAFYKDEKVYFYDQEWVEENAPFEFIMYRAINYLANSSEIIDRNKLYEEIGITEFVEIFEELEQILQNEIIDEKIWQIHATNHTTVKNLYDTCIHYRNLKAMEENKNIEKNNEINQLNAVIQTREAEIEYMQNSKSWKITKPLRTIYEKVNKDKERNKQ